MSKSFEFSIEFWTRFFALRIECVYDIARSYCGLVGRYQQRKWVVSP